MYNGIEIFHNVSCSTVTPRRHPHLANARMGSGGGATGGVRSAAIRDRLGVADTQRSQ